MTSGRYQPISAEDDWFVGEDQAVQWTITDESTNAPKDITGFTLQFKLAATQGGAAVLTKSLTLTTPASGICQAAFAAADTSGLTPGAFFYTVTRTDTGQNQVVAYGPAVLQGHPT